MLHHVFSNTQHFTWRVAMYAHFAYAWWHTDHCSDHSGLHLHLSLQNALLDNTEMPEVAITFSKDSRFLTLLYTTGAGQKSKKKGAGTKMLDDLKKKGKPVTPKLEEMALWLDSLDTSTLDDGQVSQNTIVCKVFCDACQHCHQFSQS